VNTFVVAVAQYALFLVALGGVVAWLRVDRSDRVPLLAQAVLAVVLVAVLVKAAGMLHTDPRPFVVQPSLHPLFPHPADNGFPSDHTALATAVALVVARYRRALGIGLLLVSFAIGAARVAAHVHHVEDIVAGVLMGAVAAALALVAWEAWARRRRTPDGLSETGVRG
jgi:undecaprenyl-diphosphatase